VPLKTKSHIAFNDGTLDLKAQGGLVITASSIHHTGVIYEFDSCNEDRIPTLNKQQLEAVLGLVGLSYKTSVKHFKRSKQSKQATDLDEYLKHGASEGARNDTLHAMTCYAIATGSASLSDIEARAIADGLGEKEVHATMQSARASASAIKQPRNVAGTSKLDNARAWVAANITNRYHFAIAHALIERARLDASNEGVFRASVRELVELTTISKATVAKGLAALKTDGFIKAVATERGEASLWILCNSRTLNKQFSPPMGDTVLNLQICSKASVLFFYASIQNNDTIQQLATRTNRSYHQARRAVLELESIGSVKRHKGRIAILAVPTVHHEAIVKKRAKMKEQHHAQRIHYNDSFILRCFEMAARRAGTGNNLNTVADNPASVNLSFAEKRTTGKVPSKIVLATASQLTANSFTSDWLDASFQAMG